MRTILARGRFVTVTFCGAEPPRCTQFYLASWIIFIIHEVEALDDIGDEALRATGWPHHRESDDAPAMSPY
jgi:hypothetical protein